MEALQRRRVLIVANQTSGTSALLDRLRALAEEQPSMFSLLIPDAKKSARTDWTLEVALPLLRRAAGRPVDGLTGGADPFEAVRATVADDHYDLILISTLPQKASKWLRRDLPRRVQALGVPVEIVTPESSRPFDQGVAAAGAGGFGLP
jgi:hypothetical protein